MASSLIKSTPQISVIIRSKNEERFIGQTLGAIFDQDYDLPFEVLIIDSGSTDRTLEIVRQFNIRLYEIEARRFTFGHGLNYGAGLAVGKYLINLSAHCIPTDSKWMSRLLNPLRSNPSIAATYGKQVPIKGLNPFEERLLIAAFTPDDDGRIKPPFSNSNCAIRKTVWETYPFDERASFAEDFIWSQVLAPGYRIEYVPAASVYHTHPLALRYWSKRSYDSGRAVQYLKYVYGLRYPWHDGMYEGERPLWKRTVKILRRFAVEGYHTVNFLFSNGYIGHLAVLPLYLLLGRYFFYKGLVEGRRLYGSSAGQPG